MDCGTAIYKSRRDALRAAVAEDFPRQEGVIVLCAAYETSRFRFWQDSTFFYFTGIEHPGCVAVLELNGRDMLYIPVVQGDRSLWVKQVLFPDVATASYWGFDTVEPLGNPLYGYHISETITSGDHIFLLEYLKQKLAQGNTIFSVPKAYGSRYEIYQRLFERWGLFISGLMSQMVDIAVYIAALRRKKSHEELALIQAAVDISVEAHQAAAGYIKDRVLESTVHAALVSTMTARGAREAFPSIVAAGASSTILHYDDNNALLVDGDLVLIDSGASVGGYAADLSRTYPVSGIFTERQRQVYEAVLATQLYVAEQARPGMWLRNNAQPQHSLQHLAQEYLEREGFAEYFVHGIGHFLGLDVHDVGDVSQPLAEGDVITVEPGVYLREEGLGVRIEDNFVITGSGAECLSDQLPRSVEQVSRVMR